MTNIEYIKCVHKLGLTPYSVADILGVSIRQSYRYAAGDAKVPTPVAKILAFLIDDGGLCRLH